MIGMQGVEKLVQYLDYSKSHSREASTVLRLRVSDSRASVREDGWDWT